jgi:hypothetical protein
VALGKTVQDYLQVISPVLRVHERSLGYWPGFDRACDQLEESLGYELRSAFSLSVHQHSERKEVSMLL